MDDTASENRTITHFARLTMTNWTNSTLNLNLLYPVYKIKYKEFRRIYTYNLALLIKP